MSESAKACMMCRMRMAGHSCTKCGVLVCDGCFNARQQACRACAAKRGAH